MSALCTDAIFLKREVDNLKKIVVEQGTVITASQQAIKELKLTVAQLQVDVGFLRGRM
jgi:hypothetical protein